jgi:imidazoleglycerol-phosphate dehydratase
MPQRSAERERRTKETDIRLALDLDGEGKVDVSTGVGFFDHMLTLLGRHGLFDLTIEAAGDIEVDAHHTVEDVGLLLGEAFAEALGEKTGIARYGAATIPMDEARVSAALDLSGRPFLACAIEPGAEKVGGFDTALAQEFFQAFANRGGVTLHITQERGGNAHHVLEAAFKAVARALRGAVRIDAAERGVPSSKGVL